MERRTRIDSGLPVKKWYQSTEAATEIYNMLHHATIQDAYDWIGDKTKRRIYDIRVYECHVETKIDIHVPNLNLRKEDGCYMGITATKVVIKNWRRQDPNIIKYCITVIFNEYNTTSTDWKLSLGSTLSQNELKSKINQEDFVSINHQKYPLLDYKIERIEIQLLLKGSPIGIIL